MLLTETRQKNEKIEKENTKANKLANAFLEKVKRYNEELARKEKIENEIKALQLRAVQVAQDIINLPLKGEKTAKEPSKKEPTKKEAKVVTRKPVVPEPLVRVEKKPKSTSTEVFSHAFIAPEYELDKDEPTSKDTPVENVDTPAEPEVALPAKQEELISVSEPVVNNADAKTPEPVPLESIPVIVSEPEVAVVSLATVSEVAAVSEPDKTVVSEELPVAPVSNAAPDVYYEEPAAPEAALINQPVIEQVVDDVKSVSEVKKEVADEATQPSVAESTVETSAPIEQNQTKKRGPVLRKNEGPLAPVNKVAVEGPLKFIDNNVVIEKAMDQMVEGLSEKDKKVIEKVMATDKDLKNASPKNKKNVKAFLQNSIVKYFSGIKLPAPFRKIIATTGILSLAGIGVMSFSTEQISGKNVKDKLGETGKNLIEAQLKYANTNEVVYKFNPKALLKWEDSVRNAPPEIDSETYNILSPQARLYYIDARKKGLDTFFIVDKPTATLVAIGKGGKTYGRCPVLLGKKMGETPNQADPNSDVANEATTPMGMYFIGKNNIGEHDKKQYNNKIYSLYGTDRIAIHETYPGELKQRTKSLKSETVADNRMSWGCINLDAKDFDRLLAHIPGKTIINGNVNEGTALYITPDYPEQYVYNALAGEFQEKKSGEQIARNTPNGGNYFGTSNSTGGPG